MLPFGSIISATLLESFVLSMKSPLAPYEITRSHITHNREKRKDLGNDQRQFQLYLTLRRFSEAGGLKTAFRAQSDPMKHWDGNPLPQKSSLKSSGA